MSSELKYAVHHVRTPRPSEDLPASTAYLQWVANTATLIYGEHDAVLVDTHTTPEQNAALVEWVRSFGRTPHARLHHARTRRPRPRRQAGPGSVSGRPRGGDQRHRGAGRLAGNT